MVVSLLGVPIAWRDALVFISGLFLVLVSLGPIILKRLQVKTKPKKIQELPKQELKFSENQEEL